MMNSNTLKLILTLFNKLLLVFILIVIIDCDAKPTRQDLKNAANIGQTLRKNKSSTSKNIKYYPQGNDTEESYTVQKHTLKPGETLQDLAALYNTDVQAILKANGIEDLNELKPGQTIFIPIKKSSQK